MHLSDQKQALRLAIKDRLSHLSETSRHAESRTLCREILKVLPKDPAAVCAYFPLTDEADVRPLLQTLLEKNIPLFLPRFEKGKMLFRQARSLEELVIGPFGIPEPLESSPLLNPTTLQIALIPGRAFDRSGNRLGRGNGGYDIWIAEQRKLNAQTTFWGVCLECQLVQDVPSEEHDQRVDAVITARGQQN